MVQTLMTAAEAADHYKVSVRTIRRWIATGEVQVERPGGRTVRVIVDRGQEDEQDR